MPLPQEPFETGRLFTPRVDRYSQITSAPTATRSRPASSASGCESSCTPPSDRAQPDRTGAFTRTRSGKAPTPTATHPPHGHRAPNTTRPTGRSPPQEPTEPVTTPAVDLGRGSQCRLSRVRRPDPPAHQTGRHRSCDHALPTPPRHLHDPRAAGRPRKGLPGLPVLEVTQDRFQLDAAEPAQAADQAGSRRWEQRDGSLGSRRFTHRSSGQGHRIVGPATA
jgi:hypothetical protein